MITATTKVHALLKAGTFTLAHLNVRDDVVAHRTLNDAELRGAPPPALAQYTTLAGASP
jgi:hypothetical protein